MVRVVFARRNNDSKAYSLMWRQCSPIGLIERDSRFGEMVIKSATTACLNATPAKW